MNATTRHGLLPRRSARILTSTSALMWGVQFSFLNPVLALLLVTLYGATAAEVGWTLAVFNVSGFIAALVIPAIADRTGDYLVPLLCSAALTGALTLSLALITTLPMAALALVVLGGPASVGVSMLFAEMRAAGDSRETIINTRALFSFAWVAGPPVATIIMSTFGNRSILIALAVVSLANISTTLAMIAHRRRRRQEPDAAPKPGIEHEPVTPWSLVVVVLISALLAATNNAAVAAMSLVVTERLGLPLIWAGIALGVAAGCEIPALLIIGRLTRRFSNRLLIATGCVAGILYYGGMTFVTEPVALVALQVFNAWLVGVTAGVGMTWFQQIIRRPGLATGVAANARRGGAVLSGGLIAFGGMTELGFQGVFALCAVLSLIALGLVALVRTSSN
ncbi:MFS transporter [Microbacterium sp. NPDC057650]|uniref:MFS transporter n=1 Tax=unclassified Microbacterium TaxID=2609290 RepID=UPI00366C2A59